MNKSNNENPIFSDNIDMVNQSSTEDNQPCGGMAKAVEDAAAAVGVGFNSAVDSAVEKNEDILIDDNLADNIIDISAVNLKKIASYEQQIVELKEQVLRNVAETENVRRRSRIELEKSNKYAITGFARDMIGVVENLHRAIDNIPEESAESNAEFKTMHDGVSMTLRELENVMERHGITRISPQGEKFDHNFHQAMVQIDTDEHPAGTIMQVMQAGYSIHDRLLQPAMVGVAKAPASTADSGDAHVDTQA